MTFRIISFIFLLIIFFGCNSQDKKLANDISMTACFKKCSSIIPTTYNLIPEIVIQAGDGILFDFIKSKREDKEVINGDTFTTADTDFFERVTFVINSYADTFCYSGDSLKYINGFYEFHGGETPIANTDFRIKKGLIKGYKTNGNWFIEAIIGVVDKQKPDSIIREIKFREIFKNCN